MSRMLQVGDVFEATPVDARFLVADASAEEMEEIPPQRAKPSSRETARTEPEARVQEDDYEDMSQPDLLKLAQDRGLALPSGYVRKDVLIDILEGRETFAADDEDEDDGA
jgi:hypothetical protein